MFQMHKQPRPRELACKKYIKKYGFAQRYVIANSKSARPRIAYKTKSFLYNKGLVNPHCQGFTQSGAPQQKSTPKSIGLRNGSRSRRAGQPSAGIVIKPVGYLDF